MWPYFNLWSNAVSATSRHIWHSPMSPACRSSHDTSFTFLFRSLHITDWSLWVPGGWHLQAEIPHCWQTLAAARRTHFLLHRQRRRHHLVLQQHCGHSTGFLDAEVPVYALKVPANISHCFPSRALCGKLRRSLVPCWFLQNIVTMESPFHLVPTLIV